ncbi:apolipoprotein M-like [Scyliorhinus torazame]|uniref:apolipoprotein M-like n=1 Tax=Scyliorhinus torazame TaxID=75743 RepID=UPI003B5C0806
MMLQQLWNIFLCLVLDFPKCKFDGKVPGGILSTAEYSGKWFMLAMAADSKATVVRYTAVDSAAFVLTSVKDRQILHAKGALRLSQSMECNPQQWTYQVDKTTQELTLEGSPFRKIEIFVVKPTEALMFLDTQDEGPETFTRLYLYGRSPTMSEFSHQEFEQRAKSLNLNNIAVLKQVREPCEI